MCKKLLISVFLFFFIFSFSVVSQEFKVFTQKKEWQVRMQAEEKDSGVIIYVGAAIGDDEKGDGTEKKPYKTIGRALEVAESGDTINVGPGDYYESLEIRALDQIILEGSGSGSTTIEGTIYAGWLDLLRIEGFTITSLEEKAKGIWCDHVDSAIVKDCIIEMTNGIGLRTSLNTSMWIYDSQIINSGVIVESSSYMRLENCIVSGSDWGIVAMNGADLYLFNSEVSYNSSCGIDVDGNSQLNMNGSSIHHNTGDGIWIASGGVVLGEPMGNINRIYNNKHGIFVCTGGFAWGCTTEIYDNEYGIFAMGGSFLHLMDFNLTIRDNDCGVRVTEFAHAIIWTPITGNDVDVQIDTGGQAICNPDIIDIIVSDCEYCQKENNSFQ